MIQCHRCLTMYQPKEADIGIHKGQLTRVYEIEDYCCPTCGAYPKGKSINECSNCKIPLVHKETPKIIYCIILSVEPQTVVKVKKTCPICDSNGYTSHTDIDFAVRFGGLKREDKSKMSIEDQMFINEYDFNKEFELRELWR